MRVSIPLGFSVGLVRWVHASREMLSALHSARTGGWAEKVLATGVVAGTLAEVVLPRYSPDITLRQYGFEKLDSGAGRFFADLLRNSDLRPKSVSTGQDGVTIDMWTPPSGGDPMLATLSNGRWAYDDSIFVKVGYDPTPLFRHLVWEKGDALMVSAQIKGSTGLRYSVRAMVPPGRYAGTPNPVDVARRLMKAQSETRSLLLAGPTGSGKSTMARLIAHEVAGSDAKTLKIAGSVLKLCPFEVALDLATYLRPTVLLLDDVPLASKVHMDELLSLFEALHGRTKLIVSTYMDDDRPDDADGDGSDYWPGMRPGRIDEVERTKRPSLENRRLILQDYFAEYGAKGVPVDDVALACEGLTGAYLKEVAYRISRYGMEGWQEEVRAVRRTAPFPKKEKPSEGAPPGAPENVPVRHKPDAPSPEKRTFVGEEAPR